MAAVTTMTDKVIETLLITTPEGRQEELVAYPAYILFKRSQHYGARFVWWGVNPYTAECGDAGFYALAPDGRASERMRLSPSFKKFLRSFEGEAAKKLEEWAIQCATQVRYLHLSRSHAADLMKLSQTPITAKKNITTFFA